MARKLGSSAGMAMIVCTVLAGCQSTGTGSRFANNNNNTKSPAMAKQGAFPPPSPVGAAGNTGLRTAGNQTPNNFSTAPGGAFPTVPSNIAPAGGTPVAGTPAGPAPSGPAPAGPTANAFPPPPTSNLGAPATSNRPNNVTFTQPDAPIMPPPPPAFTPPGISPIQ